MFKRFALVAIVCGSVTMANAQAFTDTFDTIDPAWVTDRYEPHGFTSSFFDGDNRLKIEINQAEQYSNRPGAYQSAFYNTQGRQRAATLGAAWELSGDLYVSEDMLSGNNRRRTDLWGRDSAANENDASYPILGIVRNDAADPFNASATNFTTRWRAWDSQVGWIEFAGPQSSGWHHLSIIGTGTTFEFRINGNLIYTDNTGSLAGSESLQTAFVQAYNFGDATNSTDNYSVYWDNVSAQAVPEPASMAALGLGAAALIRRRKKA